MNCKKCGSLLEPTDKFCKICGEPVATEPVTNTIPVTNPVPTPTPTEPSGITQPTENVIPQPVQPTPVVPEPAATFNPVPPVAPAPAAPEPLNPVPPVEPMAEPVAPPQPINPAPMGPTPSAPVEHPNISTSEPAAPEKKKGSPVLVVLLLLALIAVISYIVIYFTHPFDKNNGPTDDNNEISGENLGENTTYAAWMNYLLEQNITNATLDRIPQEGEKKTASLTTDNLKDIFEKLLNYQLVKNYTLGGGGQINDNLTIEYTKDDSEYVVRITNGIILADNSSLKDADLLNALEDSKQTIENEELLEDKENPPHYNFIFSGYDKSIFDEYFVTEKNEDAK